MTSVTLVWLLGPAFPSIVCALDARGEDGKTAAAAVPDCHRAAATSEQPAEPASEAAHSCCDDAATSCCLRAFDLDGAVGGTWAPDTAVALPTAVVSVPRSVAAPPMRLRYEVDPTPPPGGTFQVLRL